MSKLKNLIRFVCPTSGSEYTFYTTAPVTFVENFVATIKRGIHEEDMEIDDEYTRVCNSLEALGFDVEPFEIPESNEIEF